MQGMYILMCYELALMVVIIVDAVHQLIIPVVIPYFKDGWMIQIPVYDIFAGRHSVIWFIRNMFRMFICI